MEADLNYCYRGGYLVGTGYLLGVSTKSEIVGCNALFCSRCKVIVKSWSEKRWRHSVTLCWPRNPTPEELAKILEAEKLVQEAYSADDIDHYLEASSWTRAYACQCLN